MIKNTIYFFQILDQKTNREFCCPGVAKCALFLIIAIILSTPTYNIIQSKIARQEKNALKSFAISS